MDNQKEMKTTGESGKQVFISDRMFLFQHISIPLTSGCQSRVLRGSESPDDLDSLVRDFLSRSENHQAFVFLTDDTYASWETFLLNFDVVEAAGGLVLDKDRRLLMIHRYGKWDLPKGKLEPGEDVLQGAIREVVEECGIRITKTVRPLDPSHHTYVHKGRKCLKRTHWFLFSGEGSPVPQAEEGIDAAEWLTPDLLTRALEDTYSSIRWVVFNAINELNRE